jgi:major capsid protein gp7
MFNQYPTLTDIAALDGGIGSPVIKEAILQFEELKRFPATRMKGTSIQLTVRDESPRSRFRDANEGTPRVAAKFKTKLFSTAFIDHQVAIDIAVLYSSEDIARTLEEESIPHMESVMANIARQIWYGKGINDPKGFVGLGEQYAADSLHEIDLGQTEDTTSVWFVNLGPKRLQLVFGEPTLSQRDWRNESAPDSNGNFFDALTSSITGRVGLRLENKHAAMRIKGIGNQELIKGGLNGYTEGGLSDRPLFTILKMFSEINGVRPNAIFMNPRSLEQLRASRVPVNATGDPVPLPDRFAGIPIFDTINIINGEEKLERGNQPIDEDKPKGTQPKKG